MGLTLKDVLDKANEFGDDLVFKDDKGNELKLGDMRTFRAGLDSERKNLETEKNRATTIAKEAEGLLEALKKAVADSEKGNTRTNGNDDKKDAWKKNPLIEELVPVIESLEASAKAANDRAASAAGLLTKMSAFYGLERMRSEYSAAPESFRKAKKFEEVVADAIRNKDVIAFGEGDARVEMPTLSKVIDRMTEPDRIAAAVADAIKKNNSEWEAKQRMAAGSGRSGGGGTKFSTAKAGEAPIKKLDELTGDAVLKAAEADPEFAKAIEGSIQ